MGWPNYPKQSQWQPDLANKIGEWGRGWGGGMRPMPAQPPQWGGWGGGQVRPMPTQPNPYGMYTNPQWGGGQVRPMPRQPKGPDTALEGYNAAWKQLYGDEPVMYGGYQPLPEGMTSQQRLDKLMGMQNYLREQGNAEALNRYFPRARVGMESYRDWYDELGVQRPQQQPVPRRAMDWDWGPRGNSGYGGYQGGK